RNSASLMGLSGDRGDEEKDENDGEQKSSQAHSPAKRLAQDQAPVIVPCRSIDKADKDDQKRQMPVVVNGKKRRWHVNSLAPRGERPQTPDRPGRRRSP